MLDDFQGNNMMHFSQLKLILYVLFQNLHICSTVEQHQFCLIIQSLTVIMESSSVSNFVFLFMFFTLTFELFCM